MFRRHQTDLMGLRRQQSAHMMSAAASFHSHRAGLEFRSKRDNTITPHPPSHNYRSSLVEVNDTAAVLAQIDTEGHYAHGPFLPFLNTDILHRCWREGRAIPKRGRQRFPSYDPQKIIPRLKASATTA